VGGALFDRSAQVITATYHCCTCNAINDKHAIQAA